MEDALEREFDQTFDGEDKMAMFLKLDSDAFSTRVERIKIRQIGFTEPVKAGRKSTMAGLTAMVKQLGVLTPIHVMTVPEDSEDDEYKYILLDGLRRVYSALKTGQEEVNAIVWDFKDKDQGADLALFLTLLLNRTQSRKWGEIWHLYQVLELQSSITPGTLEYLLQLESGDAMKLKDVMLSGYSEVKEALLNGEKGLEACYKMLMKLRKEEDRLAMDDVTGVSDTVEGAEGLASPESEKVAELSEQDVLELLDMAEDLNNLDEVSGEDFKELNTAEDGYEEHQQVGDRHPLDPDLRSAVLARDNFRCACCGFGGAAALGVLAVHHKIPVADHGADSLDNLVTLCLNHHILIHVAQRNGGKLQMTEDEFGTYTEEEQTALKRVLKFSRVAVEADKRCGRTKEQVVEDTKSAIRHPMPGAGLAENRKAYDESSRQG